MRKLKLIMSILESEFFAEVAFLAAIQSFVMVAIFGMDVLMWGLPLTFISATAMTIFVEWLLTIAK